MIASRLACATPTRGETVTAAYLAECDGARSKVREALGIGFSGGTYPHAFYVADVTAAGGAMDGEIHVDLDAEADFPLSGARRSRLVGTVLDAQPDRAA